MATSKKKEPKKGGQFTPKQARFVEEYMVDLNATQAAIRAGYSKNTAASIGHENLIKPEIAAAILEAQNRISERTEATTDDVMKELGLLGFANAGDYFDWGPDSVTLKAKADLTREQMAAVAEVSWTKTEHGGTIRLKLHDKRSALVDIGKHLGMFVDRSEVGQPGDFEKLSDEELDREITNLTNGKDPARRSANGAGPANGGQKP
jgi:phage terminase small subunit